MTRWRLHRCVSSAAWRSPPVWTPVTTSRRAWRANWRRRRSRTADWADTWRRDFICPWTRLPASSPDTLRSGAARKEASAGAAQAVTVMEWWEWNHKPLWIFPGELETPSFCTPALEAPPTVKTSTRTPGLEKPHGRYLAKYSHHSLHDVTI